MPTWAKNNQKIRKYAKQHLYAIVQVLFFAKLCSKISVEDVKSLFIHAALRYIRKICAKLPLSALVLPRLPVQAAFGPFR